MENEQLMSGGQVVKYLQLNQSTIYDVAQKGELPAIKLGQIWCFRRAELDVWLEAQKVKQKLKRNNSRGQEFLILAPLFF
ncbi:MAG: helix-turn-helix domain-containing protein [Anaerolineae bacterium]|nr:helix-turn-helix domain-containing protein [Anaerolineae bacterium]